MANDDKNDPNEKEEVPPDEDGQTTPNEGEDRVPDEENKLSLEGETFSSEGDKPSSEEEDPDADSDSEGSAASEDDEAASSEDDEPTDIHGDDADTSDDDAISSENEEATDSDGGDDDLSSKDHESSDVEDDESADFDDDEHHGSNDDYEYSHLEEDESSAMPEDSVTSLESVQPERHEDEDLAILDETIEEGHMSFLEHLDELRVVLFKSAAAFLSAFIMVAVFFRQITGLLRMPVEKAMANHGVTEALVTTSPFGVFSFLLQLGFLGGIALASPFILYFASSFIAPGLNKKERRTLLPGAFVALLLFTVGCAFSYTVLVPSALNVSIYLNELLGFSLVWAADRYMNLLIWMVLGIGLSFEFPLVITILVYVGILSVAQLKQFRRYAVVIIFVLAAFITPTADPITQGLMAGPMILLYEAAIIVGGFIERRKKRAYEAEYGSWDEDESDEDHD